MSGPNSEPYNDVLAALFSARPRPPAVAVLQSDDDGTSPLAPRPSSMQHASRELRATFASSPRILTPTERLRPSTTQLSGERGSRLQWATPTTDHGFSPRPSPPRSPRTPRGSPRAGLAARALPPVASSAASVPPTTSLDASASQWSRLQRIVRRDNLVTGTFAAIRQAGVERVQSASIRRQKPAWWAPEPKQVKAIDEYDDQHDEKFRRARRINHALKTDQTSLSKDRRTMLAIYELSTHRYVERDAKAQVKTYAKREVKKKKWKLIDSIWGPRRKSGDAKDFYDTPHVKQIAFETDWALAVERMHLEKKAIRAAGGRMGPSDDPSQPVAPIDELKAAMLAHLDTINQCFICYAERTGDAFDISANSYLACVRDIEIVDNGVVGLRDADIQLIFDAANASSSKKDGFNSARALNRFEWLGVLVRLALVRHIETDDSETKLGLAEAVHRFFLSNVRPNVPLECFQDSNSFRADFCYTEDVDMALREHETSLRGLYHAIAHGSGAIGNALSSTKLMDLEEYMDFCHRIRIADAYTTLRDVRLNFLWSRMVVVDENSVKGRAATVQLRFEDFLEMLVRFAHRMALPTDDEIEARPDCAHAGEWLEQVAGPHNTGENAFKEARTRDFSEPLDQPIADKVRKFLDVLIYRVRASHTVEGPLTKRDIEGFLRAAPTSPAKKQQGGANSALELGEGEEEVEVVRSGGPISLTHNH